MNRSVEPAGSSIRPRVRQLLRGLTHDPVLLALLALLALQTVLAPARIAHYPALVDWPTIAALAGLLLLTKGLEQSGALDRLGRWMIARMPTRRAAALALVLAAATLAMVLTNDVALFVVVPLTLGMCRIARIAPGRLIVFEALAVNAGSALTPIGNPQNLFLWQRSGVSFGAFVLQMAPLVAVLMALLLALTAVSFPARAMRVRLDGDAPATDRRLLALSLVLYLPFLVLADLHHAPAALGVLVLVFVLLRARLLLQIDWGLLLVFVLMFVDLRLLAQQEVVRSAMNRLDLAQPAHLLFAGALLSQFISNVPASIALADYSRDWRTIAWGVDIGGFGLIIGSLANLIALRLAREPGAWRRFHLYSVPFLVAALVVGWILL
ncbi:MAG: Inner membrane protein YbiR, putative anion permease [Burkholderiaceae bacterium]|jgi:di/tricarboxylate transporter|nr:MAG: Inner membrane protein YbiR, putative anion permease [Burkholderiaceae bacterium]